MSAWFAALAHLFGLVPGIAILKSEIGTPPGYGKLFGGVIEGLGAVVIGLLWLNRGAIKKWPRRRVMMCATGMIALFIVSLSGYIFLFDLCVVTDSHYPGRTFYFPIRLSGQAETMVNLAKSRSGAIGKFGPDFVQSSLDALQGARSATTIVLLLVYQAVFTSLTTAFGIIGFSGGKDLTEEQGEKKADASTATTPT